MQNHYLGGQAEDNGITIFNNVRKVSVKRLNDDSLNINISHIQNHKISDLINKIIILRGFLKLINSMIIDKTTNQEKMRGLFISMTFLVIFVIAPALIGSLSHLVEKKIFIDLFEGLIRIIGYLLFLITIKFLPNIKQLLKHHAAEHMVINAFENNKKLTVPAIRRDSRKNIRCGTNYFFILGIVYFVVFLILPKANYNVMVELAIRIMMLPLLSGIANELLIIISKLNNKIQSKIFKPLLTLQEFTTIPPDDQHLQSAIAAIKILQSKISIGEYKLNNYADLDKLLQQ